MENYREKLKLDNRITALCALVLGLFTAAMILSEAGLLPLSPVVPDSRWQSMWRGFCCGAACAILAMQLYSLFRNTQALKNNARLKKLYIQNHDERTIQIWTSARAAGMQAFLLFGLVAVVVSGYFSVTVSLTILGCAFFASMTVMAFKVYYSRKF